MDSLSSPPLMNCTLAASHLDVPADTEIPSSEAKVASTGGGGGSGATWFGCAYITLESVLLTLKVLVLSVVWYLVSW